MPNLLNLNPADLEQHPIGGTTFTFSGIKPALLGATEYTLCAVVMDDTGSVSPYLDDYKRIPGEIVLACRHSPRVDNLLFRVTTFASRGGPHVNEVHGFKPLMQCNEADYPGVFRPGGGTPLYDAVFEAVESIRLYAETLAKNDYTTNALLAIVTDGGDNDYTQVATAKMVKDAIQQAVTSEAVESIRTVLVGINLDPYAQADLDKFQKEVGIDQYVACKDAKSSTIARVVGFISKSLSAQSSSLGSGGPSQAVGF